MNSAFNPSTEQKIDESALNSPVIKKVYIYTLSDPRTGEVKYVGKAVSLERRAKRHSGDNGSTYKANWLKQLRKLGLKPVMELLEETSEQEWQECERFWIETLRFLGCKLTNLHIGGYGGTNAALSTRKKLAMVWKGRKHKPETILKMRRSAYERKEQLCKMRLGKKNSFEHNRKISVALKKYKKTPEHIRKIGETSKGRTRTVESRQKQSLTARINGVSEAQRAALSIGWKMKGDKKRAAVKKAVASRGANGKPWHSPETILAIKTARQRKVVQDETV